MLHDRHVRAFGPNAQLLGGSGTESVACGQHHALALLLVQMSQLCDGGRFSHAVDADDQHHRGPAGKLHLPVGAQHLADDALEGLQRVRACFEVLAAHLLAQLLHQPHGHIRARIRQDELLLQVVVQLVGDLARIHKARDGAEDGIPRFAQSLAQFFKKAQSYPLRS